MVAQRKACRWSVCTLVEIILCSLFLPFSSICQHPATIELKTIDSLISQSQYSEALDRTTQYLEQNSDPAITYRKGKILMKIGRFEEAEEHFYLAIEDINKKSKIDSSLLAHCFHDLGYTYLYSNGDSTVSYARKAIALFNSINNSNEKEHAASLQLLGFIYMYKSETDSSLKYFDYAKKILLADSSTELSAVGDLYQNYAMLFFRQDNFEKALPYYEKSLQLNIQAKGKESESVIHQYNNLAICLMNLKQYERAIKFLKKAQELIVKYYTINNYRSGIVFGNIGKCFLYMNRYQEALLYLKASLKQRIAHRGPMDMMVANDYISIGRCYLSEDSLDLATEAYEQAYQIIRQNPESVATNYIRISTLHGLGTLNIELGKIQTAIDFLIKALSYYGSIHFNEISSLQLDIKPNVFEILQTLGLAYYQKYLQTAILGDLQKASNFYNHAIKVLDKKQLSYPEIVSKQRYAADMKYLMEPGIEINHHLFQLTDSTCYLQRAYDIIGRLRNILLSEAIDTDMDFTMSFQNLIFKERNLKSKIVDLELALNSLKLTESLKKLKENLFITKEAYYSILDSIQTTNPEYYQIKFANEVLSIDSIQKLLQVSNQPKMIIEYFVGNEHLFIFSFSPNHRSLHKKSYAELGEQINNELDFNQYLFDFLKQINLPTKDINTDILSHFLNTNTKLSKFLLPDIPDILNAHENIIVIPDRSLGYLPFELLISPPRSVQSTEKFRNLPYWLFSKTIQYEYASTNFLNQTKSQKPKKLYLGMAPFAKNVKHNLAIDNEIFRDKIFPIPNSYFEVQSAAKNFHGDVFFNHQATKSYFTEESKNYRIIHLATHALVDFNKPVYESGILFRIPEPITSEKDYFLTLGELSQLNLTADLAILSGCNTGSGYLQPGEGIVSVGRYFRYAGCSNLVVNLWKAHDYANKEIITSFVKKIKQGECKAEALRAAKVEFLVETENEAYTHPFYWASLVLIGDNQPIMIEGPAFWKHLLLIVMAITVFLLTIYFKRFLPKRKQLS